MSTPSAVPGAGETEEEEEASALQSGARLLLLEAGSCLRVGAWNQSHAHHHGPRSARIVVSDSAASRSSRFAYGSETVTLADKAETA